MSSSSQHLPSEVSSASLEHNSDQVAAIPSTIPISLLGSVNPLPRRRMVFSATHGMRTPEKLGNFHYITYNPFEELHFINIAEFWPVILISNLVITIMSRPASAKYMVNLVWAWVPHGETTPTSKTDALKFPTANFDMRFAPISGSPHPNMKIECPLGSYNLQRSIKPKPAFGGYPTLWLSAKPMVLQGQEFKPNEIIYGIKFEFDVQIGL